MITNKTAKHECPTGESILVWAGSCALAADRHPNADYPQPADVRDARIALEGAESTGQRRGLMPDRQTETADPDAVLAAKLESMGKSACPSCGRRLDRGDVAWNEASTSEGTPITWAHIQCQACDTEVAEWWSWWPGGG